jgi:hypothetical protein
MQHIDYNAIRLIRYSKLIDKAILEHRYSLATHLAYRCLLEYNRLFVRFLSPNSRTLRRNAFQLSLLTIQHLRNQYKSVHLFNVLRSTYFITHISGSRYGDKDLHIDLATATFARDQALAISNLLFGSMKKLK